MNEATCWQKAAPHLALLARRDLFIAELYQSEASLEAFFLELTGTAAGEGARAGMAACAGPSAPGD